MPDFAFSPFSVAAIWKCPRKTKHPQIITANIINFLAVPEKKAIWDDRVIVY